jgi:hypothetical protein
MALKSATCGSPSRMHTEAAASAARAPKNPLVRPAGGRFVRLGLHLIALQLCCQHYW